MMALSKEVRLYQRNLFFQKETCVSRNRRRFVVVLVFRSVVVVVVMIVVVVVLVFYYRPWSSSTLRLRTVVGPLVGTESRPERGTEEIVCILVGAEE
jgi:hypothetical protein